MHHLLGSPRLLWPFKLQHLLVGSVLAGGPLAPLDWHLDPSHTDCHEDWAQSWPGLLVPRIRRPDPPRGSCPPLRVFEVSALRGQFVVLFLSCPAFLLSFLPVQVLCWGPVSPLWGPSSCSETPSHSSTSVLPVCQKGKGVRSGGTARPESCLNKAGLKTCGLMGAA